MLFFGHCTIRYRAMPEEQSGAFRCSQTLEKVRDRQLGEVAEFASIEKRAVAGVAGFVPDVPLF